MRFFIRHDELALPADWQHENPDLAKDIADQLRVLLPQGLSLEDLNAVKVGIAELASFLDMVVKDPTLTKSDQMDENEIQKLLVRHGRSRGKPVTEGEKTAGGETDVIVDHRCLIENKIDHSGRDPWAVKAEAPFQANRYAQARCLRVFFTLVAYKPCDEADVLRQTDAVRVCKLNGLPHTAVEIRFVIPFGKSLALLVCASPARLCAISEA